MFLRSRYWPVATSKTKRTIIYRNIRKRYVTSYITNDDCWLDNIKNTRLTQCKIKRIKIMSTFLNGHHRDLNSTKPIWQHLMLNIRKRNFEILLDYLKNSRKRGSDESELETGLKITVKYCYIIVSIEIWITVTKNRNFCFETSISIGYRSWNRFFDLILILVRFNCECLTIYGHI